MKRKLTSPVRLRLVMIGLGLLAAGNPAQMEAATAPGQRVLRLARPSDPQSLDWARVLMQYDTDLMALLNVPLLDVVNGIHLTNWAAKDWSASADARTYTFQLCPEIKFSNGRPVVAADYAYALDRLLDPATAAPLSGYFAGIRGAAQFISAREKEQKEREHPKPGDPPRAGRWIEPTNVAGIRTPNPALLIIEMEQPDPTFPYVAATLFAAQPQEEVERLGARFSVRPVGSGPYVVAEWTRGVRLVFAPNPHYAGQEPRHFDRIEIMIGGGASTHLMMFERGELDIADIEWFRLPIADHNRIIRDPRWRTCLEQSRWGFSTYVSLNTELPPLDNPKVRQAFNYAVDKPWLVRSANGRVEPATGILPPFVPGYNPDLKGYPYDRERATNLLIESGVAQPIRLTLWHPADQESQMMAQGIQSDLNDIGVKIELKPVTASELGTAMTIRSKVSMALFAWVSSLPDPKDLLGNLFDGRTITTNSTIAGNTAFYSNSEVNQLLDEAGTNVILSTRYALYQQAEEIIVRDAPCIFLGYPRLFGLKQPWIKGQLIEPLWGFRLDRVWMER